MSKPRSLSKEQARRVALHAQGFGAKDRSTPVNRGHLRRLVRHMHIVQLDSVPVIIRTQYMPAFSRLGPYDPSLLDDIAYRHDDWFEAFVHEASLVPVEDEPLFRFMKERARSGQTWGGLVKLAEEEGAYIDQVLQEVRDRGPLKANELSDPRPREGEWWGSRSIGTLALDYLFRIGAVGIRRVGNFEKEFDLLERIVPDQIIGQPTPSDEDALKELLVRSAAALGIATGPCLTDYFRLPKRAVKPLFAELVEDGRLVVCDAPGTSRETYMHPDTVVPRSMEARALLSPFDPIVWFRERASWLFDFGYRIEIYVPKPKRTFGYYVLPFLLGDEIVGRCDLKTDRTDGVLRLLGAFVESGIDEDAIAADLAAELQQLAAMVGVDRVSVDCSGRLANGVKSALQQVS
jgi:uncharacterized protein YcaQ